LLRDAVEVQSQLTPRQKEVQSADGRWWLRQIVPYRTSEHRIEGVVVTFVDVTGIKQADRQSRLLAAVLLEQEERIRCILDTATDAIITLDARGLMQRVNPATERMFGFTSAEMIGQNVSMQMPSPYREEHDGYLTRYLRSGEARIIGKGREVEGRHMDGTTFPVDLAVSKVNHTELFTGIIRDISQRKRLEREIVEIAELEQKRIGQELHDNCGQELTALGLLADSLVESLKQSASQNVEIACKVEQGIRRVLRQVRNISRGLVQAAIDPAGLPAALAELTSRLSETSGVRCVLQSSGAIAIKDSLTASHLFHIAQEACTNALKHAQAKNVEVRLQSEGGAVILEIQDDGMGIAEDAREGLGRRIMSNRAGVIGASLTTEPATPRGTVVTCTLEKERSGGEDKK
jgi:PAS domain S-box-containing protein